MQEDRFTISCNNRGTFTHCALTSSITQDAVSVAITFEKRSLLSAGCAFPWVNCGESDHFWRGTPPYEETGVDYGESLHVRGAMQQERRSRLSSDSLERSQLGAQRRSMPHAPGSTSILSKLTVSGVVKSENGVISLSATTGVTLMVK